MSNSAKPNCMTCRCYPRKIKDTGGTYAKVGSPLKVPAATWVSWFSRNSMVLMG
jgi:hypothetical protein